jgi:hypothetical protein
MSIIFKKVDRNPRDLFPESVEEWLPESLLARFVMEIVDHLDISQRENAHFTEL